MNISVIIPCIHERASIRAAIESARTAGAAEILVADGGSSDDTAQVAQAAGARVLSCPLGRAVQMNQAAREARGDVLLFLHADCRLPETACAQIENAMRPGHAVWGAFRQRIDDPQWIFRSIEWGNAARVRWQRLAYGDQAMFVRRLEFERIGGFEPVALMEDVILSQRLAKIARPILLPGPVVVSARRWRVRGPIRQTLQNWGFMLRYWCGASPAQLAQEYRRHDQHGPPESLT